MRGTRFGGTVVVFLVLALAPVAPATAATGSLQLDPRATSPAINPPGAPVLPEEPCADTRYPDCRRLRYFYGPIDVTPGANYQMVGPIVVPKPNYDGYMIGFRPDLVHSDGSHPLVDHVMLHHATWFAPPTTPNQIGQFVAAGEEKTIFQAPHGYGVPVGGSDPWWSMFMIHSSIQATDRVWLEYDVDYVPKESAEAGGVKRLLPVWLDVGIDTDHPFYPVFNAVQGYGHVNRATGRRECAYPRERCAATGSYDEDQPGNGKGYDYPVGEAIAGTLVLASGHLHPGGLRNQVSVIRGSKERLIADLPAVYWDPRGAISPDFSMTVTPKNWRVRIQEGDVLRLNSTYDTDRASWYEGMGIVLAFVAPDDESGVDPFSTVRVRKRVRVPARRGDRRRAGRRRKRTRWVYRNVPAPIPMKARVTHGQLPENRNYGGAGVTPLPRRAGDRTDTVAIAGFKYVPGDLSDAPRQGIPRVGLDSDLTFVNLDGTAAIWHTITTCRQPCTGVAGVGYPLADDPAARLDSLELGFGPSGLGYNPGPTKPTFTFKPRDRGLAAGNVYTYFCRVHPFMRGAFEVVE